MARGWTDEKAPSHIPTKDVPERAADGTITTQKKVERGLLVAGLPRQDPRALLPDPLTELAALAKTAGVVVCSERVVQRRDKPDSATYVGKGTVERIAELCAQEQINVVL